MFGWLAGWLACLLIYLSTYLIFMQPICDSGQLTMEHDLVQFPRVAAVPITSLQSDEQ